MGKREQTYDLAAQLFAEQPQLIQIIPVLLASRDTAMDVLAFDSHDEMYFYNIDFAKPDKNNITKYLDFMRDTGLLYFIGFELKQSLVDYVLGVQAGLDTNGRKNRSGSQNEDILERNLAKLASINPGLQYKAQATRKYILENWHLDVPEVLEKGKKGGRRYDGAIYNPKTQKVTIIETNFYGGGGSKLKAVAGEFSSLYETSLKDANNVNFVWISDGPGWDTAKNPMREAFDVIPLIINLSMVKQGMLAEIVAS